MHVRTHQGAVSIIVLQEWDQRRTDRNDLLGRNVHVIHLIFAEQAGFAFATARYQFFFEAAVFVQVGVRLGNNVVTFFDSRQVMNLVGHHAVFHATVRGFQETILVGLCVHRQGVDQTDVRTFRGFDWTHTTVVSRVNVSHFKASTLTGQTARAQSRNTTLVRHF